MPESPEADVLLMPLLCDLDGYPHLSLQFGVGLVFYSLDRGEEGFTVSDIRRDLLYDRTSTTGAATVLANPAYGLMDVREPTTTLPTLYTARPAMEQIGDAYNRFTAGVMAKVLLGEDTAVQRQELRTRALSQFAFGYKGPSAPVEEDVLLFNAVNANLGHREAIVYRALASMAVRSRIDVYTTGVIRRIVRRERLGRKT